MQNNEVLEYIKEAFELKSQKCYKQAIEMLYKALETENENIEILFQLGELYFLLKNFPRALHYLEKVLEKNPKHLDALKISGKIYLLSGNYRDAYNMAQRAFDIDQTPENILCMIDILAKTESIEKIAELEKNEISNYEVIYGFAKAYYDNGKLEAAKQRLEKTLNLNPDNADALVLLGKIYFDENEFEKSKNIFNTFPKTSENPEVLNYLGLFALEDMKFVDAIKYFSKASNIDKQNDKYFYNLANAYFYNGWFEEAKKSYLQALYLAPDVSGYRYSLAYLYFEEGNFEKAQKEIDFILEHDPQYACAHVLNALLKFENKDFLGAKTELENNLHNGNDDNLTLVSLSKVYKELAMYKKAEETMLKVISQTPESLNYKCQLAEIYIDEKEYDKALNIIDDVTNKNENYISAYITGARASYLKEDYDKCKEFAQNAISLDMNYAGGYYYLSLVRLQEKDYDEAIECMKRAIMYDVNNPEYYAKMSIIYKEKKDYKTALEYIKEAESISSNTEYKLIYSELASLNRKQK